MYRQGAGRKRRDPDDRLQRFGEALAYLGACALLTAALILVISLIISKKHHPIWVVAVLAISVLVVSLAVLVTVMFGSVFRKRVTADLDRDTPSKRHDARCVAGKPDNPRDLLTGSQLFEHVENAELQQNEESTGARRRVHDAYIICAISSDALGDDAAHARAISCCKRGDVALVTEPGKKDKVVLRIGGKHIDRSQFKLFSSRCSDYRPNTGHPYRMRLVFKMRRSNFKIINNSKVHCVALLAERGVGDTPPRHRVDAYCLSEVEMTYCNLVSAMFSRELLCSTRGMMAFKRYVLFYYLCTQGFTQIVYTYDDNMWVDINPLFYTTRLGMRIASDIKSNPFGFACHMLKLKQQDDAISRKLLRFLEAVRNNTPNDLPQLHDTKNEDVYTAMCAVYACSVGYKRFFQPPTTPLTRRSLYFMFLYNMQFRTSVVAQMLARELQSLFGPGHYEREYYSFVEKSMPFVTMQVNFVLKVLNEKSTEGLRNMYLKGADYEREIIAAVFMDERVRTDFVAKAYTLCPEFLDNLQEHIRNRELGDSLAIGLDISQLSSEESINEAYRRAQACVPYAIVQVIRELYGTTGINLACSIDQTTGEVLYKRQQEMLLEEADMCLAESVSVITGMPGSYIATYPELMARRAEIHMRASGYSLCRVYISDAPESGQGTVNCECIDISASGAIDDRGEVSKAATALELETMPENVIMEENIKRAS
ncbi:hypothetical protein ANAPRD1_00570 [Anaplasma phagocytophilum]|uniref:hypothetical protein n=1 Tax=Anaplasma phagocytophilum TaxID=948 RepID=UPI0007DF5E09|nr:hypothetical protein [Anaplasma phagocytophilum]SCV64164.1 hypothetical protein ANAPRD1_00570 [Anaplasma phagocytophilum]